MHVRMRQKAGFPCAVLLTVLLSLPTILGSHVSCAEEYVYYGVVPGRICYAIPKGPTVVYSADGWEPDWEGNSAYLSIVALKDDTNIEVYTLPDKTLMSEAKLDSMEKHFVTLSNGTRFKVVSDKLVFVMLLTGEAPTATSFEGVLPTGFCTSTDGSHVGKEFIFMASQGLAGEPYRILALEPSEVTIYEEDGTTYGSFSLKANEFKSLSFTAFEVYKVASTGSIMIQSDRPEGGGDAACYNERTYHIPSPEGGFLGKVFYSWSVPSWDARAEYGFRISCLEDAKVVVWSVEFSRKIQELEVKAGVGASVKPMADEIMIESDKPVSLALIHNGSLESGRTVWSYGAGVNYFGVRANEETPFFLPTSAVVEAYVFAYEDTVVEIDDVAVTLSTDSFFLITVPGAHKILSDKDIAIQVVHWPKIPAIQGIRSFGAVIPCMQKLSVTPDLKLTPLAGEGFPTAYVMAGVAAAVVITAAGLLATRRRTKGR